MYGYYFKSREYKIKLRIEFNYSIYNSDTA